MRKTHSIPVSNGIFAHCQQIGSAIWVFLWMIDHTTKESASPDGGLDGFVYGGQQVRASIIAKDLGLAVRTVHEHIEKLCKQGYVRRIENGEGMPAGYAVRKSKKWRKNEDNAVLVAESNTVAENHGSGGRELSYPRGFTVSPRENPRYPRENPLPIRKTVQDNTEQTTKDELVSDGKTGKPMKPTIAAASEDIERVYQAYPLKKAPGAARIAISKAVDRLSQRGEADPATFLINRIAEMKAARARDAANGNFVPHYKYPATWFNQECYDEEGLQPVKNFLLPNGVLGTEAELQAQTGWRVMRGVA
jgi:hypothetical protein